MFVHCSDVKVYGHAKRFVHRVWPRPHARLFLQTVSPHFRLAVWSRASAAHIDAALLALDPRKEFLPRRYGAFRILLPINLLYRSTSCLWC